jgi:hypothetical protein
LQSKSITNPDGTRRRVYTDDEIEQKLPHLDLAERQVGRPALEGAAIMSAVQASTAYTDENGGIGRLLSDIYHASAGNDQIRAQLIGKVKQLAPQAGRTDLAAPFSAMYEESKIIGRAGAENRENAVATATARMHDTILETESAGVAWGAKGAAAEQLLPAVQRRIQRTSEVLRIANQDMDRFTNPNLSPDQQQVLVADGRGGQRPLTGEEVTTRAENARREYIEALASTVSLGDIANQTTDEKRRLFREGVMDQQVPGTNQTVSQAIREVADDPHFIATRSFYEQQYRDAQARQLQLGIAPRPDLEGGGAAGGPQP